MPPTNPYEHDLAYSYWDKQYAQAEYAIEELYPHRSYSDTHPNDYYHFLNEETADVNEYLSLYGASELFG